MRPAIDPAQIRRQSRAYKIRRYWVERITGSILLVTFMVALASIDSLLP